MKSPLTDFQKLSRRRSARIISVFFAGLMLLAMATFALRGASANTFNKLGINAQSRAGKLIKKIAPHAFAPKLAARSAPFACNNLTVNTLSDGTDITPGNGVCETATGNGICTLRAAIQESNASTSCAPLTISFSANGTMMLGSNLPNITRSVTITGNGPANTIISGNNLYRSLNSIQTDGITVTIQNLKATNGFVAGLGFGGAIDFDSTGGTLTVNNVELTNGSAGYGGGLNADGGTVVIKNSIIRNNTANTVTGGVWSGLFVTSISLVNTLVTGNSGPGGGVFNNGGVLHIYNSTVVGNSASSSYAAGVDNNGGTMTLYNSILADNSGGGGDCDSFSGHDVKNTLIKSGSCGITHLVNGNLTGDPALNADYTLASTSNAVGTGNNSLIPSGVTTDLAGNARIQQGTVDMGAYESTFPGIVPVLGNYSATTVNLGGQTTVTPSAAPTNATNLVATASSGFNGTFYATPATGVVKVINAHPAGTYTFTITSSRPAGSTSKTFTLTVQDGTVCATTPLFTTGPSFSAGTNADFTAVGDFNNDGKQDLAIANYNSASVSIRLGDGAGGFTNSATVSTASSPSWVAVGDFNGDGNQDFAAACSSSVSIRLGDGAGNFSGTTNISVGSACSSVALGDFNGDGKLDFVTTNNFSDTASVRLGNGLGSFASAADVGVGDGPAAVVTGDFDNDGDLDFATSNLNSGTVSIRLNDGTGTFSGTSEITVGAYPEYLELGDFNKDGKLDFVASNRNSGTLSLRFGNGAGGFTGMTDTSVGSSPGQVVVADLNNDGKQDLAVRRSNLFNYLLGDGLGGFGAPVSVSVTGASSGTSLALGDFNGDGRQDLIADNSSNGTLYVRLGGCNVAPTITAGGPLTRQAGSTGSSATVATVSDTETAAGSLTVAATTVPIGITVTGISNSSGTVTATVTAACNAAVGANTVLLTVTDGNGATATANLTVNVTAAAAPSITIQPANQTVCVGSTATFSVAATGAGLTYQWRKNGVNISGATSSSYTTPATVAGDNGALYSVVVSGMCGTPVTSSNATLTVNPATAITTQPVSLSRTTGQSATFSVVSTGAGTLSYQWRKNGNNISGATGSSYTIASVAPADAGNYSVVVTGTCGSVTSNTAVLNVDCVIVTVGPSSLPGGGAGMAYNQTITALPAGSYTFTVNSGALPTGLSLHPSTGVISGTPSAAGTFNFSITATDANSCSGTQSYSLVICAPPAISTQPIAQTVCAGAAASFSVTATGSGLTYQWRKDGVTISGATASSLALNAVTAADAASYDVVVTGTCGTLTSNTASLTINTSTNITTQPQSQTICAGAPVSFTVVASGSGTITYQWRKNGANVSGATAASFNLPSVAATDAGSYDVVVASNCGTTTSTVATLTVNAATAITTHPATQTKIVGQSATFTVAAAGVNLTYQWRKNTTNIPGATSSSYSIASVVQSDAGSYDVVVTGACGTATSNAAVLTVNCPAITLNPATLPSATTGAAYSQTITATGGTAPYSFTVMVGSLPAGLTLSTAGLLSGTATASGSFTLTVRATDSNDCFGERQYTIGSDCATVTVNPANPSLPGGMAGTSYSQAFTASGGAIPYEFSPSAGTLPAGLNLNSNGTLVGTPTGFGNFSFTVKATDNNGCLGERGYALRVCAIITVAPTTLPSMTVGVAYNQTITASGGAAPYSVAASGNLPLGLSLNSDGTLSGTPTQSGTFNFTVTATDALGCTSAQSYMLGGSCQTVTVNQASLPNGFVGTAYGQSLSASGGTAPYDFTVSAGKLPGGLALSTGGALTGTPTANGTFTVTVRATDTNGCFGERSYTLLIGGSGLMFYPLPNPVRLLETRAGFAGCSNPGSPINSGGTLTQAARSACSGIPAAAAAVTGNITVVPSGAGYLTLFPSGAGQPTVANSNFGTGEITNNVFTVGLSSADGTFKIFSSATTEVIIDVTGYYAPPITNGLYFHPLPSPVRLLETRAGQTGCIAPGAPLTGTGNPNSDPNLDFSVQGRSPVASPCNSIPATAQVLVGNATSVLPSGLGYLTIYPNGGARPTVASSNYAGSDVINGPFAVKLGADGKFNVYTLATTNLVIDILGYYSPDAADANGAGLLFNPLPSPVRLLETRPDFPGFPLSGCTRTNAPIQGNLSQATHTQPGRSFCGLPASAQALAGNVTVANSGGAGFLTLFPGNLAMAPLVATSNYPAPATFGYNRHYLAGLSPADGTFKALTQFTTDLIVDVAGYFAP